MSRLLRFLGIQAGEGALAGGLFAYSLLIGFGRVFVLTASQALFLQFYPASDLAYVYMIAAVATIVTSAAYLKLGRIVSPTSLVLANLAFTLAVTLALRAALATWDTGWPAMALAAWFHVMFALTSFAFWGTATRVVDIRQGKRLFPIATTGDVVAFSLGGFFVLRSVDQLGTANLLWIGAAGFGLAIVALLYTLRQSSTELEAPKRASRHRQKAPDVQWSSPYLRLMMVYMALSAVVFVLLDNAFSDVAQRRFDSAAELARFFGTYSALAAIVNFFFRSLFAGRLVRRFGMIFGLAILPVVVGLGAAAVGLGGTLGAGLAFVFWFIIATRLSDKVLRGVAQSAQATLYQPLGERGPAVQTTMEGIVDSVAIGLIGAALLVLNRLFEVTAVELSVVIAAACSAWVLVAFALKREFVGVLGGALHRRRLRAETVEVANDDVLGLVRAQLEDGSPEEIVYALGLLARVEDADLTDVLGPLLDHEDEAVRLEALRYVARSRFGAHRPRIEALVRNRGLSTGLRGAAVRTLAELSDEAPPEAIEALESDEPALRRGAMVGLLRSGSTEGVAFAEAEMSRDLQSENADDRGSAAEVLRDAGIQSLHRQAFALLTDADHRVRKRAVEAAAAMDHPELWPHVVEAVRDPYTGSRACEALLHAGPGIIPFLMRGFERDPTDRSFRRATLRILGLLGGDAALRSLLPLLGATDREERTGALTAIAYCGLDAAPEEVEILNGGLRTELQEAAYAFVALADVATVDGEAGENLRSALEDEIFGAQHRIFLILSFLRPGSDLLTAWENYASGSRDRRAYALELLDSHLTTQERGRVFPVLEDLAADERVEAVARLGAPGRSGATERCQDLAALPDLASWTRLCARRVGAELGANVGALEGWDAELYERTTRLRRVELFGDLSGTVLARVVPKLENIELRAGEDVIRKGDEGDGMFVILDGSVRVHDDGLELARLQTDKVFGEFTVLQRQPRTASVTTLEATRLLRFAQEDLYELMSEEVAVARAMIRVILRRLRSNKALAAAGAARAVPIPTAGEAPG